MAIKSLKASAQSISLLAADENRKGVTIYNETNKLLYVSLGEFDGEYSLILSPHAYYEAPASYLGEISASSPVGANGTIKVTNW